MSYGRILFVLAFFMLYSAGILSAGEIEKVQNTGWVDMGRYKEAQLNISSLEILKFSPDMIKIFTAYYNRSDSYNLLNIYSFADCFLISEDTIKNKYISDIDPFNELYCTYSVQGEYMSGIVMKEFSAPIKVYDIKSHKEISSFDALFDYPPPPDGDYYTDRASSCKAYFIPESTKLLINPTFQLWRPGFSSTVGYTRVFNYKDTTDVSNKFNSNLISDFVFSEDNEIAAILSKTRNYYSQGPGDAWEYWDYFLNINRIDSIENNIEIYFYNGYKIEYYRGLAISNDRTLLASGCYDGNLHIFDTKSGEKIRQFKVIDTNYYSMPDGILFSDDDEFIYTFHSNRHDPYHTSLRLWHINSGYMTDSLLFPGKYYGSKIKETPDGRIAVWDSYGKIRLIDKKQLSTSLKQNISYNTSGFPNPFTDRLTISFDCKELEKITAEIYNIMGERVPVAYKTISKSKNNITFDTSALLPGIYFININDSIYSSTIKAIKISR